MTATWFGQGLGMIAGVVVTLAFTHGSADAARARHQPQPSRTASAIHSGFNHASRNYATRRSTPSWRSSGLQCVPFARENSGIELTGNAGTWWGSAAGLYERGARPEVGSVLNFRATGRMRLGHIAVVTNVITPRHIEIDHANWGSAGRISRDIDVVDVSPDNDWTAVRVALGHSEDFGSIYPTYGFIYDRPDHGTMVANSGVMPAPTLQAAPADLRPADERIDTATAVTAPEEVAEAADDGASAPRGYRSHRAAHATKSFAMRSHRHGGAFPTAASTYRASTSGSLAGKPHRIARRHF